jgi:DNA helicase-2/ATP-dependent DNA helicase PcrA
MEVLANRGKTVGVVGLPHIFESFEDRKQILLNAVRSEPKLASVLRESGDHKQQQAMIARWLQGISDAKNSLLLPSMIEDRQSREIYEAYDAALRACNAVDYDDLLLLTYRLFEERPQLADFYRRQYRYICVDEAQDLNEAQYRLLCALCGKDYFNVMLVGDPKQAIYVWNGGDPKYMDLFQRDFKAARIMLTENFRSSKQVVTAAQRLEPTYTIEGQLPIQGTVEIISCTDEDAEAEAVVARIKQLLREGHPDIEGPVTLQRCAVLARNRFSFGRLEKALEQHGLNYFKKFSAAWHQSESEIIEEFELALRILANPLDRLHVGILATKWGVRQSVDAILAPFDLRTVSGAEIVQRLAGLAVSASGTEPVCDAVAATGWSPEDCRLTAGLDHLESYALSLPDEERVLVAGDLAEWRKHWDYFVRSSPGGQHSIGAFLGQVALGTTQQPNDQGLGLLTVHSAKGMEFDVVFVIGMTEGTFPDYRARGKALEEEQRSAFVAITRSKRLLYLTYPEWKKMPWGDVKRQARSRYLGLIMA